MAVLADAEKVIGVVTTGHATLLMGLCLVAGGAGAYALWHHTVYTEGFDACTAQDASASQAAQAKVDAAQAQVTAAVSQGELAVTQAKAQRPTAIQTAQKAAQAVPVFAATMRPPDLAAQRERELAAIAAASGSQ